MRDKGKDKDALEGEEEEYGAVFKASHTQRKPDKRYTHTQTTICYMHRTYAPPYLAIFKIHVTVNYNRNRKS